MQNVTKFTLTLEMDPDHNAASDYLSEVFERVDAN